MSARIIINCDMPQADHPGGMCAMRHASMLGTREAAREEASGQGWACRTDPWPRDVCPFHVKEGAHL